MDLELGAMILQRFGPSGSQACIQPASSDKYARKGQFDITMSEKLCSHRNGVPVTMAI